MLVGVSESFIGGDVSFIVPSDWCSCVWKNPTASGGRHFLDHRAGLSMRYITSSSAFNKSSVSQSATKSETSSYNSPIFSLRTFDPERADHSTYLRGAL